MAQNENDPIEQSDANNPYGLIQEPEASSAQYNENSDVNMAPAGQVQCDITGQWLAEEDTIILHGKRVSAEGKQIFLQQLEAGELLPGEYELPSKVRRLLCIIGDGLLMLVPVVCISFGLGMGLASFLDSTRLEGIGGIIAGIIGVIYFGAMHAATGQTVGKKIGKLQVQMLDGEKITTQAAYVRAFVYSGIGALPAFILLIAGNNQTAILVYAALSMGVGLFGLVNALFVLFRSDQRAIHDLVAGTRVVQIDF